MERLYGLLAITASVLGGVDFAAPVVAQDSLPNLFDVMSEIEGREVQVDGLVGNFDSYGPTLRTDDSSFRLTYALPREKLKIAEGCKLGILSVEKACRATVHAEIRMNRASVNLLVFDITFHE